MVIYKIKSRQHRRQLEREARKKGLSFEKYLCILEQTEKLKALEEENWKKIQRGEVSKPTKQILFSIWAFWAGLEEKK